MKRHDEQETLETLKHAEAKRRLLAADYVLKGAGFAERSPSGLKAGQHVSMRNRDE